MAVKRWAKRIALVAGCVILAVVLAGFLLEAAINSAAAAMASKAMSQFPGDRVDALIALVNCETCSMPERNHAVWALGQMQESRALDTLREQYTGGECSHHDRLCQYELRKAIGKIDGTWGMLAVFRAR